MIASVAIVAFNEENYIYGILDDILKQDYPQKKIELILIDSLSTDNTRIIMEKFCNKYFEKFYNIVVLSNIGKIQSCGWNVAISNFNGDVLFRIDAHAKIPHDFVSKNMKLQSRGEFVTGGPRYTLIDKRSKWAEFLLTVENSIFGSSIASYRRSKESRYVKSLFHGAYRRCVLEKVGFFNVNLGRTEDNEFHYRIRQAGYKIYYSGEIYSYQYVRNTLIKMIKQKYSNGFWVGKTFWICPKCLEKYHFVPMLFVSGIILTSVLYLLEYPLLGNIMWCTYFALALVIMIMSFFKSKFNLFYIFLPIIFFVLHVSYGIGTVKGLFKL